MGYVDHGIKIVQSAVKVRFKCGKESIVVGVRHHDCYQSEHMKLLVDMYGEVTWRREGFITNEPHRPFLNREEAFVLVGKTNQCFPVYVRINNHESSIYNYGLELKRYTEALETVGDDYIEREIINDEIEWYTNLIKEEEDGLRALHGYYRGMELFSEDLW